MGPIKREVEPNCLACPNISFFGVLSSLKDPMDPLDLSLGTSALEPVSEVQGIVNECASSYIPLKESPPELIELGNEITGLKPPLDNVWAVVKCLKTGKNTDQSTRPYYFDY